MFQLFQKRILVWVLVDKKVDKLFWPVIIVLVNFDILKDCYLCMDVGHTCEFRSFYDTFSIKILPLHCATFGLASFRAFLLRYVANLK